MLLWWGLYALSSLVEVVNILQLFKIHFIRTISAGERPMAARLLRSWVQIPPGAWIFVCCECRVLSGRGLCDELITRPEESYRLCCVVVCDLEKSRMGAPYIYDISRLKVNDLTLILLTWRKWWAPNNASKQHMGFNSGFKGLIWVAAQHYSGIINSFIHLVVCLTTGPKPLPKRALHIVRSRASSFKWEYPLLSLRLSNSFLRPGIIKTGHKSTLTALALKLLFIFLRNR